MLNGVDPILIFNFAKIAPSTAASTGIPIVSRIVEKIPLLPIPIYLSESLTGIYIDTEDKSVDIETSTETTSDGSTPIANQKGVSSIVRINMIANADSIGMILLSTLIDLIFEKVTSKEYSIYYFHKGVAVFDGLLHSFNITQGSSSTLYNITLELSKSTSKPAKTKTDPNIVEVDKVSGTTPLAGG